MISLAEFIHYSITIALLLLGVMLLSIFPDEAEFRYDEFIIEERLKYLANVDPNEFDEEKYEEMCRERPTYQVHDTIAVKHSESYIKNIVEANEKRKLQKYCEAAKCKNEKKEKNQYDRS